MRKINGKLLTIFLTILMLVNVAGINNIVTNINAEATTYNAYRTSETHIVLEKDGKEDVAYCFNENNAFPEVGSQNSKTYTGYEATAENLWRAAYRPSKDNAQDLYDSVLNVIYNGYPRDNGGFKEQYNIEDTDYRYATQLALWYLTDSIDGFSDTYTDLLNPNTISTSEEVEEKIRNVINGLLDSSLNHPNELKLYIYNTEGIHVDEVDNKKKKPYQNLLSAGVTAEKEEITPPTPQPGPIPIVKNDFTLSKVVEGGNTQQDFIFNIELKYGGYNLYEKETVNGVTFDRFGIGTIKLKDGQSVSFNDLSVGTEFTVKEQVYTDYTTSYNNDDTIKKITGVINSNTASNVVVKNTFKGSQPEPTEKTSISVSKEWVGEVGTSATIKLLKDGQSTNKSVVLNAENSWTATFDDLDAKNPNQSVIQYTVSEDTLNGYYDAIITGDMANGYVVKNIKDTTKDVTVKKEWVGPKTDSVEVVLIKNNVETSNTITLNADNNWENSFNNLPVYDSKTGNENIYTVKEVSIPGYTSQTTYNPDTKKFIITNTNNETVDVNVTKEWVGQKSTSATFTLVIDSIKDNTKTLELTEQKNWQGSFRNLPKYKADGTPYVYTIEETPITGYYDAIITGDMNTGFTVKNVSQETINITFEKEWIGNIGTEAVINLTKDGNAVPDKTVTLNTTNNWQGSFDNLAKYDETGREIVYSIEENAIAGYTSQITKSLTTGKYLVKNTYKPNPITLNSNNLEVKVNSILSGKDGTTADEFIYKLLMQEPNSSDWVLKDTKNINHNGVSAGTASSQNFSINDIEITKPGTYKFQITNDTTILSPGVTKDAETVHFDLEIIDVDGNLTINNIAVGSGHEDENLSTKVESNVYKAEKTFTNVYEANSVTQSIAIQKIIDNQGGNQQVLNGFQFGVYQTDETFAVGQSQQAVMTLISGDSGRKEGSLPAFSAAGKYYYVVKEKPANKPGYTYSTEEYKVTITVVDDGDGNLNSSIVYKKGDTPYDLASFTNVYKPTAATLDIKKYISIEKILYLDEIIAENRMDIGHRTFEFNITNADGIVSTAKIGANPKDFDILEFDKIGTYHFGVKENNANPLGGITYDTKTYDFEVIVTDDNGTLKAEAVSSGTSTPLNNQVYTFNNIYRVSPTSITKDGLVTLEGRDLVANEFSFKATQVDALGSETEVAGGYSNTKTNTAAGVVDFDNIDYNSAGTYYYRVEQIIPGNPDNGITYDDSVYTLKVPVADNQQGRLEIIIDKVKLYKDGDLVTGGLDIIFNNRYEGTPVVANINATKNLVGKNLLNEEFAFTMTRTNDQYVKLTNDDKKEYLASNDVNGLISFTTEEFSEVGKYYFLIEEVEEVSKDYITYDDTKYYIEIDIIANGKNLEPRIKKQIRNDNGELVINDNIVFNNTYAILEDAEASVMFNGIVKVEEYNGLKDINKNQFEFVVTELTQDTTNTVGHEKDGSINYGEKITYTKDDVGNIYNYTIKQTNGGKTIDGYEIDGKEYNFLVKVLDDLQGGITLEITDKEGKSIDVSKLDFTNRYRRPSSGNSSYTNIHIVNTNTK